MGSRTCTILFTDLVGSTALRSALGDVAFDERRRVHDRLLAEAIGQNGGELLKHEGDGVMAVFGSAADAIACAAGMQRAIDRGLGEADARFSMRAGASAGDVSEEDGDVHGTPVVEAARLCAAARGGQVLVSDVVRVLAGSRSPHVLAPAGTLELKGLDAPVVVWEVAWTPDRRATSVPTRLAEVACARRVRRARCPARATRHGVETGGGRRTATRAGRRRARDRQDPDSRPRSRRWRSSRAPCCTDGATRRRVLRTRRGCTRSAGSCAPPTTTSSRRLAPLAPDLVRVLPELARRLGDVTPSPVADSAIGARPVVRRRRHAARADRAEPAAAPRARRPALGGPADVGTAALGTALRPRPVLCSSSRPTGTPTSTGAILSVHCSPTCGASRASIGSR